MTDFGGKTSIFSHPVYLFLRKFSLQDSRGGSQGFLRKVMGDDTPAFQDLYPGWFVSYKADVVEPGSKYASARYSRGNGALPKDCRIIFFHGKPRPREVSEDWLPLISSFFERESE
ncbi:hypothetical protein C0R78_26040 (plasmid) [Escherichia coli]|nr:hypothetical protein C0R78_26040 [Escherichia coli]